MATPRADKGYTFFISPKGNMFTFPPLISLGPLKHEGSTIQFQSFFKHLNWSERNKEIIRKKIDLNEKISVEGEIR
jgi:hypothetical protein